MRSKASFKSHPIHPILVSFPIAFLIGTFVADVIGKFSENNSLWQTGFYLEIAGIVTGLLAAIPGFIDYLFTVPPNSSAKKRGLKHALVNVSHLVLFFIAWLLRGNEKADTTLILIIEAVGVILIFIAGYLGGTLVYRNQIGVDPRYAEAGKWKEEYLDENAGKIKVATTNELKLNQMKLLHVGHKRIVLGKTEKGYVAFDDHCTHKGGSLAGGAMICDTVQCPWHGSQFDVNNGNVKAGPAKESIKTYPLTETDGGVFLQLP
ncbi:MAG TPA: DUF2231 domain-containing protein [Hanamia sp.]|nr:DUF2231 domain-containing protein [Hanamia sp.]